MAWQYGENVKVTVFGQSHSEAIGVVIDGFPSGVKIDGEALKAFMARRAPGQNLSTPRKEKDEVEFLAGLNEQGLTCGSPICAIIRNTNVKSGDYENLKTCPRPSHTDLVSLIKNGEGRDIRGGGQFSGRLTAPLCIAGSMCLERLKEKGVKIGAHLLKVGQATDDSYSSIDEVIPQNTCDFPCVNSESAGNMKKIISDARADLDSVGAILECKVVGFPAGIGEPMFDGVENALAKMAFAIPAVKGFEIGAGFSVADKKGSENNDEFTVKDGAIKTKTNNDGGVNGGISNGMPIVFRVAIKPTPSIGKEQTSVNVNTLQEEKLTIKGRHDPCIGVRAVPVLEACTAIALYDLMTSKE